jgi:hypothetical protein
MLQKVTAGKRMLLMADSDVSRESSSGLLYH